MNKITEIIVVVVICAVIIFYICYNLFEPTWRKARKQIEKQEKDALNTEAECAARIADRH